MKEYTPRVNEGFSPRRIRSRIIEINALFNDTEDVKASPVNK